MFRRGRSNDEASGKMPLLAHLEVLRRVIVVSVITILITSVLTFSFVNKLLFVVLKPASDAHIRLVYTGVTEGIFFKMHVALVFGAVAASPVVLWQLWNFLMPAFYPNERKYITSLIPISISLFVGGVVFGYFTVLPVLLYFLIKFSSGFQALITISNYLSFTEHLLIPFGLLFEYPLLVYFLTKIRILTVEKLVKYRKYAIVGIVIVASILTPTPDPFSTLLVAVPMVILYEVGVIVARVVVRKKRIRIEVLADEQV